MTPTPIEALRELVEAHEAEAAANMAYENAAANFTSARPEQEAAFKAAMRASEAEKVARAVLAEAALAHPVAQEAQAQAGAPHAYLQKFRVYPLADTWVFDKAGAFAPPNVLPPGEYGIFALPTVGLDHKAVADLGQFLRMPSEEKKAAVRYLWLRDSKRINGDPECHIIVCRAGGEDVLWGDAMDRQIDAEMGGEGAEVLR